MKKHRLSFTSSGLLLALIITLMSFSVFSMGSALAQTTTTAAATTAATTTAPTTTLAATTAAVTTAATTTLAATTAAITTVAVTTAAPSTVSGASSGSTGGQGGVSGLPATGVGSSATGSDQTLPVIFLIMLTLGVIVSGGILIFRTNRKS